MGACPAPRWPDLPPGNPRSAVAAPSALTAARGRRYVRDQLPPKTRVTNVAEANQYLKTDYRAGWSL